MHTTNSITVIFGDTQIGSTTALSMPTFEIQTGRKAETQIVHASAAQIWLWQNWLDFWDYVKVLAGVRGKYRKRRIISIHLGDVIEGNHHGSKQLIPWVDDQIKAAVQILEPVRNISNAMYGIRGTDAHDGPRGDDAAAIYEEIGVDEYDYHLSLDIDGVVHDFAHHGRVGRRSWTSAAAGLATEVVMDCAVDGKPIPRFVWRAHNHMIDDSGEKIPGTRCICTPSWQLKTSFGWRASAQVTRSDIGGIIVDGEQVDFSRARYKAQPDGRRVITV